VADRAVPRAPEGRPSCGQSCRSGGTGGRSGTPSTPGAGRPWLGAQFPAPLKDASAAAAGNRAAGRHRWAQRHPVSAGCGTSVAERAVPRAPQGCSRHRRWNSLAVTRQAPLRRRVLGLPRPGTGGAQTGPWRPESRWGGSEAGPGRSAGAQARTACPSGKRNGLREPSEGPGGRRVPGVGRRPDDYDGVPSSAQTVFPATSGRR